jgi:hypothetical protein
MNSIWNLSRLPKLMEYCQMLIKGKIMINSFSVKRQEIFKIKKIMITGQMKTNLLRAELEIMTSNSKL